ncbi:hypothetical protein GCM10007377_15740 [Galliscardovia ingluviei]|uniref:Uncharacterized protein n=1 Tax=Galliscardovia ingluviei TaxID=1769422 RepID=A0A8J3F0D7_9BIFI|nr:hypothetical protein [Galliscardovia ingluviei]GGI15406.1 hypothetical protein GCM10007377_15740 [Galliscardovia ingluviei]
MNAQTMLTTVCDQMEAYQLDHDGEHVNTTVIAILKYVESQDENTSIVEALPDLQTVYTMIRRIETNLLHTSDWEAIFWEWLFYGLRDNECLRMSLAQLMIVQQIVFNNEEVE